MTDIPTIDPPRPTKRDIMNKFWMVYAQKNDGRLQKFEVKQEAIDEAKRKAHSGDDVVYVLEAVSVARKPVPEIEIHELK